MIVSKEFFRFVENASARELVDRKLKYQLFLSEMERRGSTEYAHDARTALRIIDEEMAARCEVADLRNRRKKAG